MNKQAIYSAETLMQVEHIRAVLVHEGIACSIRNQYLNAALGELPPFECWPELWLEREQDSSRAQQIIEAYLQAPQREYSNWICSRCQESIEGQFSQCWHCGEAAPD